MKKLFAFSTLFLILSCQEEGRLTKHYSDTVISPNAILKYQGNFEPTSGIIVSGQGKIYLEGNLHKLRLENFSISSGPDLKVYLSKGATPTEFVNLGNLIPAKIYLIPPSITISDYTHVLIYCQQYSHLYAVEELIQN